MTIVFANVVAAIAARSAIEECIVMIEADDYDYGVRIPIALRFDLLEYP
jgi:hypothetical protein